MDLQGLRTSLVTAWLPAGYQLVSDVKIKMKQDSDQEQVGDKCPPEGGREGNQNPDFTKLHKQAASVLQDMTFDPC